MTTEIDTVPETRLTKKSPLPGLSATRRQFNCTIQKSLKLIEREEKDMQPKFNADGLAMSLTTDVLNLVKAKQILWNMAVEINGATQDLLKDNPHPAGKIILPLASHKARFTVLQKRVTEKDAAGKVTGSRTEETLAQTT